MVAVGFCSYWGLAVAAAAGSTAAAVAVSGYFYTTLELSSSLHCHAVCRDAANWHWFATNDLRKGRFAACGPKFMCVDAGFFPYLVLDLVFFLH